MLVLSVPEMSCSHCIATIEKAVKSVDPVARLAADLAGKEVSIETSADPAAIEAAMSAAGYDTARR